MSGTFSTVVISLVCLFACFLIGKIYSKGRKDSATEIENAALKQANKAIKDNAKREQAIDETFDKIESKLPSDWPESGLIDKLLEDSASVAHRSTASPVPSKRKPSPARVAQGKTKKAKPRRIR